MISARPVFCAFLGRRFKARCHRCQVDLPGRYTTRHQALAAGDEHLALRHVGAGVA